MKITASALKQFRRMDRHHAERLRNALKLFEETGQGDVKPLQGRNGFRLRVGDYRAIFEIEKEEMVVLAVGPRGDVYK